MDLAPLLDSCSWYDMGSFLQTCIKNSLCRIIQLKSRALSHSTSRCNYQFQIILDILTLTFQGHSKSNVMVALDLEAERQREERQEREWREQREYEREEKKSEFPRQKDLAREQNGLKLQEIERNHSCQSKREGSWNKIRLLDLCHWFQSRNKSSLGWT